MQMDRIDWNRVHLILHRSKKGHGHADKILSFLIQLSIAKAIKNNLISFFTSSLKDKL